ncbi:MAG: peptide-N4-asparagine amidase [Candidatus Dormibacteria bacterium]
MTLRSRRLAVAAMLAASVAALTASPAGAAARHRDLRGAAAGTSTLPPQQQVTADMAPPVPNTTSCTTTLSVHDFAFSYGAPDKGTYAPPAACPGPWAAVILTLTSSVSGNQFDRSLTVSVGDVVLLHGTTSEPCCIAAEATPQTEIPVTWTVQRDVTADSLVLQRPTTYAVQLDNVVNATYTGVYHTTVTLTYYEPAPTVLAARVPAVDIPITTGDPANMEYTISKNGQTVGRSVTFPHNLVSLSADLFTNGQGPCEEFWWSEPGQCASGTPFREVAIYLDGHLAGAAPVYPTVFTGGDGPGLWEPIPSPRTWNLRPYTVDLTPFVASLADGLPHQVTLGVLDAAMGAGDFWPLAATLHGDVDAATTQTTGWERDSNAATPTDDTSATTPATYSDNASHALTFTGAVVSAAGSFTDTVTENASMKATEDNVVGVATDTSWTWNTESNISSLTPPMPAAASAARLAGTGTDTVTSATYSIVSTALTHFAFTDNARTTVSRAGVQTAWSEFDDSMETSDASGIVQNGVEDNTYRYGDSTGICYDRTITAPGTGLYQTVDGSNCPAGAPPSSLPETPAAAMLPIAALTLLLAVSVAPPRRLRRRRTSPG